MSRGPVEEPRQVFLEACARLGAVLEEAGFRYAPSQRRARRRRGGFVEEIRFESSSWNRAGVSVDLLPSAGLFNDALGRWRLAHSSPISKHGNIAGRFLGDPGAHYWQLVDPDTRGETVATIARRLVGECLPWFSRLESPDTVVAESQSRDTLGLDLAQVVEYLVFMGRPIEATAAIIDARNAAGPRGLQEQQLGRLRPVVSIYGLDIELPAPPPPPPMVDLTGLREAAAKLGPIRYVGRPRPVVE